MNDNTFIRKIRTEIDIKKLNDISYGISSLAQIVIQNQTRAETDGNTFLDGNTQGGLLAAIELLSGMVAQIAEDWEEAAQADARGEI